MDHPIQLGPAKKIVALPTERELERARQAFGGILLDTDTSPTPPSLARRTAALLMEEEVQQTKQALKLQTFTLEVVAPLSEDDDVTLRSALLACQISKQVASEAERDHE